MVDLVVQTRGATVNVAHCEEYSTVRLRACMVATAEPMIATSKKRRVFNGRNPGRRVSQLSLLCLWLPPCPKGTTTQVRGGETLASRVTVCSNSVPIGFLHTCYSMLFYILALLVAVFALRLWTWTRRHVRPFALALHLELNSLIVLACPYWPQAASYNW